ncbi:hypothetical protein COCMIDRAFT_27387 [Bipolaris oryzae ATCC 44560]|uniref:BTB domain-containing protein n=1 Tax=Bipolaris oryzae ATCC 44560 TaxID=930090 RepID=W6Z9P3_COCMI|nr:uncharacterized protein COCMIDRAFT_27387 [Bipolaris oryzae ATCC 44560]EUC44234.1 hypothetical protein COCMIDRAFT_27387 [Bipolaris oryzae ATCC 44560]
MATPSTSNAAESNQTKKALFFGASVRQGFLVINVGSEKVRYDVHKTLLTHHSEYFSRALGGSWKEAEENSIILNDIEPKTFEVFVHWLYTQKIATEEEVNRMLETYPSDEHDDDPYITVLTKAVVFGDRFMTPNFRKAVQNYTVDCIFGCDEIRDPTFLYASKYAFENLPEEHKLRSFFIDVHCRFMENAKSYMDDIVTGWFRENLPRTFLVGLIDAYSYMLATRSGLGGIHYINCCRYHEHTDDLDLNKCKRERWFADYGMKIWDTRLKEFVMRWD